MSIIISDNRSDEDDDRTGNEPFARKITPRMREAEHEELPTDLSLRDERTGGCELDELSDYFRSDGQDPLQ